MAPRRRVDPVLNERNRRKLARVFREVLASEPYPDRPTIPILLEAALRDAGYWEQGEEFGFVVDEQTGRTMLSVPWRNDDGTLMGQVLVAVPSDESFDEMDWAQMNQRAQRLEGPSIGDQ